MTIDEAIKHCKEEAEKYMEYGIETECYQCGKEHEQLAEWLTELKEAKRLLKAAVEGYSFIGHITKDYACPSFISCSACPMDEGKQCKIWEHEAEALKLIGGSENG